MSNIQNIQEQLKGLSVEELLVVIAAAAAEAKKAAKTETKKAPKEAKEKKGSMPKGVVPKQLHKPRAWVDYVLDHANTKGWPAIAVKGQTEPLPASVEREGKHVFESSGKPLNNKQAMSLSKQYWDRKAGVGSEAHLYEMFEAYYEPPAEVSQEEVKAVVAAIETPVATEVKVVEAPKPKAKKSEEEKAAEKLQKEAEKEAKKEAEKLAKAAAAAAEKERKEAEKEAKKEAEKLTKAAAKPEEAKEAKEAKEEKPKAAKKVAKKADEAAKEVPFEFGNDGMAHEWVLAGKKVFRDFDGNMWERTEDGEAGAWMGKYDAATKTLDASAEEPACEDE